MAINFPDAPALDDEFTDGGATWRYDGVKWVGAGGAATPPPVDAYTKAESDGLFVDVAGDVMTGNLTLDTAQLILDAPLATSKALVGKIDGVNAWSLNIGNVGTGDFHLARYDATGAFVNTPFSIARGGAIVFDAPNQSIAINASNINVAGGGTPVNCNIAIAKSSGGTASLTSYLPGFTESRWQLNMGNNAPEGGGSTGSNFGIVRGLDGGGGSTVFEIMRSNMAARFSGTLAAYDTIELTGTAGQPAFSIAVPATNPVAQFYYNMTTQNSGIYQVGSGQTFYLDYIGQLFSTHPNALKPGGGAWLVASDARIKEELGEYALGLDQVLALRPITYRYLGNDTSVAEVGMGADGEVRAAPSAPYPASLHYNVAKDSAEFVGLVAQEVETVFPGMVIKHEGYIDGEKVTDLRDMNTSELIFALVNSVKTLTARLEALEGGAAREVTVNTVNVQPTRSSPPRNGRKK